MLDAIVVTSETLTSKANHSYDIAFNGSLVAGSQRLLQVVVGAMHCNGMLRRARQAPFGITADAYTRVPEGTESQRGGRL